MNQGTITWTPDKLKAFKKAYATADENFLFGGHTFLKAYAKYLIEYLEGQFQALNPASIQTSEATE